MLSLRKSMDLYGETQSRVRTSLDAIRRVLAALERAAEILAEEESQLFREELTTVRLQLEGDADPQVIEESGEQVEKGLDGFAHGLAKVRDRKEQEYKQIIRIVAEAGVTMAQGGSTQSEELTQFAAKIDTVSRLASIAEIRKELTGRVTELKTMANAYPRRRTGQGASARERDPKRPRKIKSRRDPGGNRRVNRTRQSPDGGERDASRHRFRQDV